MDSYTKTMEKKPEEDSEVLSHGIAFVKTPEPEREVVAGKNRTTLQAEFSIADGGIEIEGDPSEKTKDVATFILEDKKDETKDDLQKVSKNKVVILPEADTGMDFPEDEDLPPTTNTRKR